MRKEAPRLVDQPEPGFFAHRLVKNGVRLAARITHENGFWSVTIDGEPKGLPTPDPVGNQTLMKVWAYAERIGESEYQYLLDRAAWAKLHAPHDPYATPDKPINLGTIPPIF